MLLDNKTILITGGTGSFGHCFTRYVLEHYNPKKIIIYSRDEFKQFIMENEFKEYKDRLRFSSGQCVWDMTLCSALREGETVCLYRSCRPARQFAPCRT